MGTRQDWLLAPNRLELDCQRIGHAHHMRQRVDTECLTVRAKIESFGTVHSFIPTHLCARELHWPGVYSVQRPPDEWPNIEALIDNNYRNMLKRDTERKGREAAVEERAPVCSLVMPFCQSNLSRSIREHCK